MKTFDRKDVFTIATIEDARKYINHEGYFCDSYYLDLNRWDKGILKQVDEDTTDYPFYLKQRNNCSNASVGFRFFLPVDKVRKEKKWRPFKSIDEFKNKTGLDLLHIVHYRLTSNGSIVSTGYGVITDFYTSDNKTDYITIGDTPFNLNELFNYEYFDKHGNWQPFGVLDEN